MWQRLFRPRVPLAWENLMQDRTRLAVSLAGIGFAVLLMFVQLGFWNAMLDAAVGLLTECKADLVVISKSTYSMLIREAFPTQRLTQARRLPEIAAAFPMYIETATSIWTNTEIKDEAVPRRHPIRVVAYDPAFDALKLPEVKAQAPLLRQAYTALMDRRSKPDYGKRDANLDRELANKEIKIVGLFSLGTDISTDGNLIMSAENYARYFPNPLAPSSTLREAQLGLIQLHPGADPQAVKAKLMEILPDDVRVLTLAEFIQVERGFWQRSTPIGFIFTFGLVIGVIVGMVICSQVLQADVSSHLKEYATLKAMGYSQAYLTWVVLQQALWLGVLGFLPSFVLSLLLYEQLSVLTDLPLFLTPPRTAVVFLLTCFMCGAAGLMAVRKVIHSDPAEVF